MESAVSRQHLTLILASDRIRVLPSEEALQFWSEWWRTEGGKK